MGLGHAGPYGAADAQDVNCKPNYASVMNYAYGGKGVGFSDGSQSVTLNNAKLQESAHTSPGNTAYLAVLASVFGYWVDPATGDVDWNRDGVMAPKGSTVRAYANLQPQGPGCEYTKYNEGDVSQLSAESSMLSPAIARLNQRSFAFYVNGAGALRYAHSDSEWLCPTPSTTPCATWSFPHTHALPAKGGVDAVRIDGPQRLLVVTVDGQGRLWESRLTTNVFQQETWTPPALIPGSSKVLGEPSLARRALCSVFLAYKTTGDELRHRKWTCGGGWGAEQESLTDAGGPIVLPSYASPGIGRGYPPTRPGANSLLGAFAHSSGVLTLWRLDETTGR